MKGKSVKTEGELLDEIKNITVMVGSKMINVVTLTYAAWDMDEDTRF